MLSSEQSSFSSLSPEKVVTIHPGELYVTRKSEVIHTLLGSCVAACLYDEENRVIGMNHFMLVTDRNSQGKVADSSGSDYYGVNAMDHLVNAMRRQGAELKNLKSKIFGAGNVLKFSEVENSNNIGTANREFILNYMNRKRIPIVASSLGEDCGRIIYFSSDDFSVSMKRISHNEQKLLLNSDLNCAIRNSKA